MFFIHPMWDSESQRIGMQRCTPTGYVLHAIGEMIGFVGLLMLLAAPVILAWKWMTGTLTSPDLWLMALPFGFGILSELIVQGSWWLALRRDSDTTTNEASLSGSSRVNAARTSTPSADEGGKASVDSSKRAPARGVAAACFRFEMNRRVQRASAATGRLIEASEQAISTLHRGGF
jgi:hypothetical protein